MRSVVWPPGMLLYSKLTDFKNRAVTLLQPAEQCLPWPWVQAFGCTVSQVLVGPPQQSLPHEIPMNVAGACMTLLKSLFKQPVNSHGYTKSFLSSAQPPATPGVCTSSGSIFSLRWALGERSGLCKAYMHGITHTSRVWSRWWPGLSYVYTQCCQGGWVLKL